MKRMTIALVALVFLSLAVSVHTAHAYLPATGQTKCYDGSGIEIACAGTGQDGEIQEGIAWQSPRFKVTYCDVSGPCANQGADCDANPSTDIVIDQLTGLAWARDAHITITKNWADSLNYATTLTLCGSSDWRVPNATELLSLFNPNRQYTGLWLETAPPGGAGFVNVGTDYYWSSTTYVQPTYNSYAFALYPYLGYLTTAYKPTNYRVWPVRTALANALTSPLATGQTTCYDSAGAVISCAATGQDGETRTGAAWPVPRYEVVYCDDAGPCLDQSTDCDLSDANNVIHDVLTDLTWTKDANLAGGKRNWSEALIFANNAAVCGYTDWRLATINELRTLWNFQAPHQLDWLQSQYFTLPAADTSPYFWSATTVGDTYLTYAWNFVPINSTYVSSYKASSVGYAWPVRGGCIAKFSDVPAGSFVEGYIKAMFCEGVTTGYPDGTYKPSLSVTRQAMAAFIIRATFGEDFPFSPTPYFSDVPATHLFFKYIQKMRDENITTGCNPSGTQYCPTGTVTRQAMAAFIIRALEGEPPSTYCDSGSPFNDVPHTGQFCKHIKRMKELNITTGCNQANTNYCPSLSVTRQAMSAFIARAFLNML